MSRVGRRPIKVPQNVKIRQEKTAITVEGPKGKLSVSMDAVITMSLTDNVISFARPNDNKRNRALHGLYRALINNMITGVTKGFSKELLIEGVGFKAQPKGKGIVLDLGFSHQVTVVPPEGVTIKVTSPTALTVEGIDKQAVGQVAANIRSFYKPEPYKGKGIRYKDEYVRRKQGKKVG